MASSSGLMKDLSSSCNKDIKRVIRTLSQRIDIAILLVEQYYDFARALADHYLCMSRGQIVKQGLGADMDSENIRDFVTL